MVNQCQMNFIKLSLPDELNILIGQLHVKSAQSGIQTFPAMDKDISVIHTKYNQMSCDMTKPTKWHVRTVKTQIRLGIHPV